MELYKKINLHSHTHRCYHAEGSVEDYVQEALHHHMKILGISDHTPFPEKRDEGIRMELDEFPEYVKEIEDAQKKYLRIKILKGLECDYTPEFISFYKKLKEKYQLDYLIGSVHFIYENGKMIDVFEEPLNHKRMKLYTEQMLGNLDTDIFNFIAHPDLFVMRLVTWDSYAEDCVREMCKLAEKKHRILEINVNGLHKPGSPYPDKRFWKIASEYQIGTIINSDAHRVENLCAKKEYGYQIQKKYCICQSSRDLIKNIFQPKI